MKQIFLLIPVNNWENGFDLSNDIRGGKFKRKQDVINYFGELDYPEDFEQIEFIEANELCETMNERESIGGFWLTYVYLPENYLSN